MDSAAQALGAIHRLGMRLEYQALLRGAVKSSSNKALLEHADDLSPQARVNVIYIISKARMLGVLGGA